MSLTLDHSGGSRLLQNRPIVYEFGFKSNMRTTFKNNIPSILVNSAAVRVNHPQHTSLMSKLSRHKSKLVLHVKQPFLHDIRHYGNIKYQREIFIVLISISINALDVFFQWPQSFPDFLSTSSLSFFC